jgi:formate-dependent nitrite reductase membrane component NrfD
VRAARWSSQGRGSLEKALGLEPIDPHEAERIEAGSIEGQRVVAVGYYGLPVLKRPHWKWQIPLYFWVSGIAGMSYFVATLAEWLGGDEDQAVVAPGRYIALAGMLAAPVLLIDDLRVRGRFHNMLRIFKTRSPMSVGSWALALFGPLAGLSAVLQLVGAPLAWRRAVGLVAAPLATFVASYTGVLLSATAVPLWGRARLLLSPIFVCSATSTALAAIGLCLKLTRREPEAAAARLRDLELAVIAGELALISGALRTLGPLARPLTLGRAASLFWGGSVGVGQVLPLLLLARHLVRPGRGGLLDGLAQVLVLLGGLATRTSIVDAGKASADDPQAAFYYHR